MEKFKIRVRKDYLTFSSAHFITLEGSQCERLHGHNYRVAAELEGQLLKEGIVFDFSRFKKILLAVTRELDHRLLVPLRSRHIAVEAGNTSVRLKFRGKEWIVPRSDCALLQLENTTAELLARYISEKVRAELASHGDLSPSMLRVEVEEDAGQSALHELTFGQEA
jgi:6-pyruvoyltetrahydropterin/6-carboxytetrahydropterin synthase